jgi:hypothetical protein
MVDVSTGGGGPLCNMGFAEGVEGYVLPAWEMEPCIEPGCCIKVHPTGAMTDAGVEAVFDLRYAGSSKSLDPCIQISEEAFPVVRGSD